MMDTILTAENLKGGYGNRTIVHDVTLDLSSGERLLIIGPNGCGKTTLFKLLVGILPAESGCVSLLGRDITTQATHLRMQQGLGYLPQTRNIFPSLSVEENLHLSYWHGNGEFIPRRDFMIETFPMLRGKLNHRAGLLSGGERQALALSMAMMRPVRMLLLDEPTAGLAPKAANDILQAVHRAQKELGFAFVIIEHNLRVVHKWVSRLIVLKQGRVVAKEPNPERLLDHNWLQEYYFE